MCVGGAAFTLSSLLLLKRRSVLNSFFSKKKSQDEIKLIRFIIQSFGYRPTNLSFFQKALSHKSIAGKNEVEESNERLEFLGDAILDAVIAE